MDSVVGAILIVLVLIPALVVVLVLVIILIVLVVVLILVAILIIVHDTLSSICFLRISAELVCPAAQDLSFGLKRKLASSAEIIAAVIPPAVAFKPPVNAPSKPSSEMASLTPFARLYPNPVRGTVAPAPAKSTSGL